MSLDMMDCEVKVKTDDEGRVAVEVEVEGRVGFLTHLPHDSSPTSTSTCSLTFSRNSLCASS